jgi:hypothetical protein
MSLTRSPEADVTHIAGYRVVCSEPADMGSDRTGTFGGPVDERGDR